MDRKNPARISAHELEKVGVTLVEVKGKVLFICNYCLQGWLLRPPKELRQRRDNGYWKCPNGCNENGPSPFSVF